MSHLSIMTTVFLLLGLASCQAPQMPQEAVVAPLWTVPCLRPSEEQFREAARITARLDRGDLQIAGSLVRCLNCTE